MRCHARRGVAILVCAIVFGHAGCNSFGEEAPIVGNDAGAEGASPQDSGEGGGPCGHTFCDDFDGVGSIGATWTTVLAGAPGFLELVQDNVGSPPNALLARYDGLDAAFGGAALLKKFDQPDTKRITCSSKLFVEKLGKGEPTLMVIGVQLAAGSPVTSTEVHLALKSDLTTLALFQGESDGIYPNALPLALRKWITVTLSLDLTTGEVVVTSNGARLMTSKFVVAPRPNNGVSFKMGAFDIGSGDENRVRYDDTYCDVE